MMQVMCVRKDYPSTCNCPQCLQLLASLEIGRIYTVVEIGEGHGDYILEEYPSDIFFEKEYFAPLSDIDEMELIQKRETNVPV